MPRHSSVCCYYLPRFYFALLQFEFDVIIFFCYSMRLMLLFTTFYFVLLQYAKTFLSLMARISKDQTVQYILTMIDDMLQVLKGKKNNSI